MSSATRCDGASGAKSSSMAIVANTGAAYAIAAMSMWIPISWVMFPDEASG